MYCLTVVDNLILFLYNILRIEIHVFGMVMREIRCNAMNFIEPAGEIHKPSCFWYGAPYD